MAASGHFGWPKITFDRISRHFRSIRNFYFLNLFTKWLPAAILNDRKSLSTAFLAISDQYATFFHKMAAAAILDDRKSLSIAFLAISDQYATFFFTKWLPTALLGDRKSLLIAFLAISDQYATFIFFHKMAASGHFGWPKITFDHISRHFSSIRNFDFFCSQNGCRRPFWMTENLFRSHFSPFSDEYTTFFFNFFFKMAAGGHFGCPIWPILDYRKSLSIAFLAISDQYTTFFYSFFFKVWFAPKTIGFFHYVLSMAMPNMNLIGEFMTQLETPQAFWAFYTKWPPDAILFFQLMPKIIGFM